MNLPRLADVPHLFLKQLFLAGLLSVIAGCTSTEGDRPRESTTRSAVIESVDFPKPDPTWTHVRYSMGHPLKPNARGGGGRMSFNQNRDFNLWQAGIGGQPPITLEISDVYARVTYAGTETPYWQGSLDDNTPLEIQSMVLLRDVISAVIRAPQTTTTIDIPFFYSKKNDREMCRVFLGARAGAGQVGGLPPDITCLFMKSRNQVTYVFDKVTLPRPSSAPPSAH